MHYSWIKSIVLWPFAILYGIGVWIRNVLYDFEVLKSRSFDMPIISVGNLAVGGTGKTPHVEYLIRLLKDQTSLAVLSRGYKRKTSGYVLAGEQSNSKELGDEPYQIHLNFPDVPVAVDADRVHGIGCLATDDNLNIETVLLDDAYQHRRVKPGLNILLTDYHHLFVSDHLLPIGRLREPSDRKDRADIVIVTKTPEGISPMDLRVISSQLELHPFQKLFFSGFTYDDLIPFSITEDSDDKRIPFSSLSKEDAVLLVTGIANPEMLISDLKRQSKKVVHLCFDDHHQFTNGDISQIKKKFQSLSKEGERGLIVTTQKDAARFSAMNLPDEITNSLYVLPIEVKILNDNQELFNQTIINYVRTNKRNSIFSKK